MSGRLGVTVALASIMLAAGAAEPAVAEAALAPELEVLRPVLGQWEVTTDWFDGGLLWAQMSNTVEAGGREVHSRVVAAEGGKEPYERYRIRYFTDDAGNLQEHLSSYKGVVVQRPVSTEITAAGTLLKVNYPPGTLADIGIRKELSPAAFTMHWSDYFKDEETGAWERVIDTDWVRTAPTVATRRTMPIDDGLFDAAGANVRSITLERVMDAAPQRVWAAWTTETGWKAAYGPDRPELRANIELAPGGKYEWFFDGAIGCNGCQVLSYLPPRMLSFTWNSPVTQPRTRVRRTWIVIEIEPHGDGQSLVRATQLGFGEGAHWDETVAYFEQGWAHVLDQMAANLAEQAR